MGEIADDNYYVDLLYEVMRPKKILTRTPVLTFDIKGYSFNGVYYTNELLAKEARDSYYSKSLIDSFK